MVFWGNILIFKALTSWKAQFCNKNWAHCIKLATKIYEGQLKPLNATITIVAIMIFVAIITVLVV